MRINSKQYARLIFELADNLSEEGLLASLKKVAKIIVKNRDEKKISKIADELLVLIKKQEKALEIKITTARPLNQKNLNYFKNVLAQRGKINSDNDLKLETIIDKRIKSGIIIQINNEIWDNSLRNRLQKISANLIG